MLPGGPPLGDLRDLKRQMVRFVIISVIVTYVRNNVLGYKIPFDLPSKEFSPKARESARRSMKTPPPRIKPIEYTEDRIRRQFFRDHPFEALRPRSLVEQGTIREEHPIQGREWTKLSQHGRTPSSEE